MTSWQRACDAQLLQDRREHGGSDKAQWRARHRREQDGPGQQSISHRVPVSPATKRPEDKVGQPGGDGSVQHRPDSDRGLAFPTRAGPAATWAAVGHAARHCRCMHDRKGLSATIGIEWTLVVGMEWNGRQSEAQAFCRCSLTGNDRHRPEASAAVVAARPADGKEPRTDQRPVRRDGILGGRAEGHMELWEQPAQVLFLSPGPPACV